jgi:hypothetical protein
MNRAELLALVTAAALLPAGQARARECLEYSGNPGYRAIYALDSPSHVAASESHAYVFSGRLSTSYVLTVLDVSDAAAPVKRGEMTWPGNNVTALVHRPGYLYVSSLDRGLDIVDVRDPTAPVLVGSIAGAGTDVAVSGGFAYLAEGVSGVRSVDVSDPAAPVPVGGSSSAAVIQVGAADGLLVATGGGPLFVYDLADPASPSLVGTDTVNCGVEHCDKYGAVALRGETAYVIRIHTYQPYDTYCGYTSSALVGIDLRDPTSPRELFAHGLGGDAATAVFLAGDRVYAFGRNLGTQVFRLDETGGVTPTHRLLTRGAEGAIAADGRSRTLCVPELRGYQPAGLAVYDVRNDERPHGVRADPADGYNWAHVFGVARWDGFLYSVGVSGWIGCPFGSGYQAWIGVEDLAGASASGLVEKLELRRATSGYGYGSDIEVAGGSLFLSGQAELLQAPVAKPGDPPSEIVPLPEVPWPTDAEPLGSDHLLVASWFAGLTVLDVTQPTPVEVATLPDHPLKWLAVEGALACATSDGVFRTIDVSDPTSPVFVGETAVASSSAWLAMEGRVAATGEVDGPIRILDLGDPAAPREVATVPVMRPKATGFFRAAGASFRRGILYVTNGEWGVAAIDVRHPSQPRMLGTISTEPCQNILALDGTLLACGSGSVLRLPLACPSDAVRQLVAPARPPRPADVRGVALDPLPGGARYTLTLGAASAAIDVYDVAGRRVRSLLTGPLPAGTGTVIWDGRNERGAVMPAGVYFLRLRTGEASTTARIVRLR